ncbi:MAG: VOC family protein [Haloarculaceae archaeon]
MVTIDHATLAGSDLATLERLVGDLGFEPSYGGPHANGETEMSLVVFPDGSYLELLAPVREGATPTRWARHLRAETSPCAWAIPAPDIDATAERAAAAGIEVDGPLDGGRDRPDGTRVAWRFAFLGPGDPGAVLPFLIDDETPREYRVPTDPVTDAVGGLARVLVCAREADAPLGRFERAFGASVEHTVADDALGATVHLLSEVAGAVVVPDSHTGPLADRLDRYGDCVCGYVFEPGTGVPAESAAASEWGDRTVEWFAPGDVPVGTFGVVA